MHRPVKHRFRFTVSAIFLAGCDRLLHQRQEMEQFIGALHVDMPNVEFLDEILVVSQQLWCCLELVVYMPMYVDTSRC